MRRTATGFAAALFALVATGGPLALSAQAAPAPLRCGTATPPPACALLDDLASQLAPISALLPAPLKTLTTPAQGFAARADQPAGVPVAEVTAVSEDLLESLDALPAAVEALVGQAKLGSLTDTLEALVAELTAAPSSSAAGSSKPTPARTATPASSSHSSSPTSLDGPAASRGSSTSSAGVPDVPVGDPLALGPLALPEFGFDPNFEPVEPVQLEAPLTAEQAATAKALEDLGGSGPGPELAVVAAMSVLLIAGAGIAQLQSNRRHTIPD